MVPLAFRDYFFASTGAGAALVGLLFVAVSIAPERTVMSGAPVERRAIATSAYSALLNAFFLSLVGLLPQTNLGEAALVLGLVALGNQCILAWHLFKQMRRHWLSMVRRSALIVVSLLLYGDEVYSGAQLLLSPADSGLVWVLALLMLGFYAIGIARAWQLLGARKFGLSDWLSPIHDVEDAEPEKSMRRP
jgi:hypothetical protein